MTIYRGIDGVNREIKQQFRGVSGVNREIKEQYRGVGGVNRLVFSSDVHYPILYLNGKESITATGGWAGFSYVPSNPVGSVIKGDTTINIANNYYGATGMQVAKAIAKGSYTNIKVLVQSCTTGQAVYFVGRCMNKIVNNWSELHDAANRYNSADLLTPNSSVGEYTFTLPIANSTFYPLFMIFATSGNYAGNVAIKKIWLE